METATDTQTFEQAVEKTVNWWAEKSFNTPMNQNNGDDSHNGGMAFALMNLVSMQSQSKVTPDKIERFKEKLTEQLLDKGNNGWINLHVDYHPDTMLSDACEYAGINAFGLLPCKTTSWIDKENKVTVSYGYRGEIKEI
jgi:hypothetical protein